MKTPTWRVRLGGTDVTRDLARHAVSVVYTDHAHGESDDVEIQLADTDGRFRGPWMPDKGTALELWIGFAGAPLLPCGGFEVDEVGVVAPPSTVVIRALATGHTPSLRTKRSQAYEAQPLRQLVATVARRHAMRVVGEIGSERINRVSQSRESDLSFLKRLAEERGYVFSVRADQLVFHRVAALEGAAATFTVRYADALEVDLRRGSTAVYRACEVRYHDPGRKRLVRRLVRAEDVETGDVYQLHARVESAEHAEEAARSALRRLNGRAAEGTVTLQGRPGLVAGTNGALTGFGKLDGKYHVASSVHQLSRDGGYTTTLQLRQVRDDEDRQGQPPGRGGGEGEGGVRGG